MLKGNSFVVFLGGFTCMCMYASPPFFLEHDLVLCYLGSMFNMVCSAVLGDLEPSPYSRCRFLLVGGSVSC